MNLQPIENRIVDLIDVVYRRRWYLVCIAVLGWALFGAGGKSPERRLDCITIESDGLTPGKPRLAKRSNLNSKSVAGRDIEYVEHETGFTVESRLIGNVSIYTPPGYEPGGAK